MQNSSFLEILFQTLILIGVFQLSFAQETSKSDIDCSIHRIKFLPDDLIKLISEDGSVLSGQVSKKVDLNFDGLDDLIVNFGFCGNWGDCLYGIYVQQEDQRYQCVFAPDYWYSGKWELLENEFTKVGEERWMKFKLFARKDNGQGIFDVVPHSILQFDGEKYRNLTFGFYENEENSEAFHIEKEYFHQGETFQVGRLLLGNYNYGPMTLRILNENGNTDIIGPKDEDFDNEISETRLVFLEGKPFFFVVNRYSVYLIDLKNKKFSARIKAGLKIEFGEDAISGTLAGLQFFDQGKYLLGNSVGYGLFCFNISNIEKPKELIRYSSKSKNEGQAYFFLEQNLDGSYNGIISNSDTSEKSKSISNLYTKIEKTNYLFQSARIKLSEENHIDPLIDENPENSIIFYEIKLNDQKRIWTIDLEKGVLIKGEW